MSAREAGAAPGQAAREALHSRLIEALVRIRRCDSSEVVCVPCRHEINEVMEAADDYAKVMDAAVTAAAAAQPAPEVASMPCEALAADNQKLRDAFAVVLDLFAKGGDGWHARISQVNLARAYKAAGLTVPEELRRFL